MIHLGRFHLTFVLVSSIALVACMSSIPQDDGNNSSGNGSSNGGSGSGPSTGASKQNLCYGPFDCNGEMLDEKCFSSQESYCSSLCSEDNCLATISCKNDCQ